MSDLIEGARLPQPTDPAALDAIRGDVEAWREGLDAIAARHGLEGEITPMAEGSLPVFASARSVVKLYAPDRLWRADGAADRSADHEVERGLLAHLDGRLAVPSPPLLGDGTVDGWRYVVMGRLPGRPLEAVLAEVDPPARHDALRRLGASVRALHDAAPPPLPFSVPDFDAFLAEQERDVARIEAARGAPEVWLRQLDSFVRDTPRGDRRPVLLHTELGPGHVLAEARSGGVELTGLIDFVDAMIGDAEYDFAAVAFFVTAGDGVQLGAFLDGYGWDGPRGAALARRLMRYLLLHRFAPLKWLLARRPPGDAEVFGDLAERWMGVASPVSG